jgi:hypothetical protein
MEAEERVIVGETLGGESRKYTFKLMNAATGLKLFYEYSPKVMEAFFTLMGQFSKDEVEKITNAVKDGKQEELEIDFSMENIKGVVEMFPKIFSWEEIEMLSKEMLAGSKVEMPDGKIYTVGDSGIGDHNMGDLLELFTALFYAIRANFPKYIDPLVGGVEGSDSTQSTTPTTTQSQK